MYILCHLTSSSIIPTPCHLVPPRPNSWAKRDSSWSLTPPMPITTIRSTSRYVPSLCLASTLSRTQLNASTRHQHQPQHPIFPRQTHCGHCGHLHLLPSPASQCATLALLDYDMDVDMSGPYDWSKWSHHVMTQVAMHTLCTPNHAMTVGTHVTPILMSTIAESLPAPIDYVIPARDVRLNWKDTFYPHVDGEISSDILLLGHNSSP
jgi:hypothetical protein